MRGTSRAGRVLVATGLVGALVLVAPSAASAKGHHPHGSTTTTTSPSGSGQPTATLVIKPASVGHVTVEAAGTTTFEAGTNGEALHVGDTIKTDSVGLAEIDYATDTYTRLDVNTTFTITKLTDSEGNRQVNGTLQSGQTWNRTVALTQSESFDQQGGGTTAAVAGTAFVVDCTTPTTCTFTGVIDTVTLTGSGGQTQTLNPLNQCVSTSGSLCASPSTLTPDEAALLQWIQQNVFLDFIEHGLGNGIFDPFGGTVTVNNGVVQSFTPSTPNQGFTPVVPPPPPSPPSIDPTNPVDVGGPFAVGDDDGGCDSGDPNALTPAANISVGDDCAVNLMINVLADTSFYLQFNALPNSLGVLTVTTGPAAELGPVAIGANYTSTDVFTFTPTDTTGADTGATSFVVEAIDAADPSLVSTAKTVQITVLADCDDPHPDPSFVCDASDAARSSSSSGALSAAVTTPTTVGDSAAPSAPPTTTPPAPTETTPTTTAPSTTSTTAG